jgi:hypothetical protein
MLMFWRILSVVDPRRLECGGKLQEAQIGVREKRFGQDQVVFLFTGICQSGVEGLASQCLYLSWTLGPYVA